MSAPSPDSASAPVRNKPSSDRRSAASRCCGLLLGAGLGSRYRAALSPTTDSVVADKLQALLPTGVPVAVAAARALMQVLPVVCAVVRPGDHALAEMLRAEGCRVVVAQEARDGMGSSLACGVQYWLDEQARAGPDAVPLESCLVALADMPWIQPHTVIELVALSGQYPIVAPVHAGTRGHPVIFRRELWGELAALSGDRGAQGLLRRHGVHTLATEDTGVLRDVDTPQDLVR